MPIPTSILTETVDIVRQSSSSVNDLGELIRTESTVYTSLPVRISRKGIALSGYATEMVKPGQDQDPQFRMMAGNTIVLEPNDYVYHDGVAGFTITKIDFVRYIFDFDGTTHHPEAFLIKL